MNNKRKKQKPIILSSSNTSRKISRKPTVLPRPTIIKGATYRIKTPVGVAFITLNSKNKKDPFEIFINIGKAGSDIRADAEAMARLISFIFRTNRGYPKWLLEQLINQLEYIGGKSSVGMGENKVSSLPDAVAKVLKDFDNNS